jgi:hypothetical protein
LAGRELPGGNAMQQRIRHLLPG